MPLFSIVIPVYNNIKYFPDCIKSILSQDFTDFEIILVDDGSTDGSEKLCDEYAKADNITAYHIGNKGVSYARNKGIEQSRGEYIWFVDSDDTIEQGSLSVLAKAVKDTNPDFISFGINERYIKDDEIIKDVKKSYGTHHFDNAKSGFAFMQKNDLLDLVADKICRRSVICDNDIRFNQENVPTEDHIFWLSVYPDLNSISLIDDCLYNYFLRDGYSSTKKLRYYKFKAYCKSLRLMISLANDYGVYDEMSDYLYRCYCYYLFWEFEILNHPDCKFGFIKRYKYFKKAFETNDFPKDFKSKAINYYFKCNDIEKTKIRNMIIKKLANNKFLIPSVLSAVISLKKS